MNMNQYRWLLALVLGGALLFAVYNGIEHSQQVAPQSIRIGTIPLETNSTPNPRCGVAGGSSNTLAALHLSTGSPEIGGYVWDALTDDNGVQVVRPCQYYTGTYLHIPASMIRYDCYDIGVEAMHGGLSHENQFRAWVQAHPRLTWLIGNEPDLSTQDGMTVTEYAVMYHYYYSLIKDIDPTAQIAIGAVSHVDLTGQPNTRYKWITGALNAYQSIYKYLDAHRCVEFPHV
jgi:hypothetical protein